MTFLMMALRFAGIPLFRPGLKMEGSLRSETGAKKGKGIFLGRVTPGGGRFLGVLIWSVLTRGYFLAAPPGRLGVKGGGV
jgi:hypothetical protein